MAHVVVDYHRRVFLTSVMRLTAEVLTRKRLNAEMLKGKRLTGKRLTAMRRLLAKLLVKLSTKLLSSRIAGNFVLPEVCLGFWLNKPNACRTDDGCLQTHPNTAHTKHLPG